MYNKSVSGSSIGGLTGLNSTTIAYNGNLQTIMNPSSSHIIEMIPLTCNSNLLQTHHYQQQSQFQPQHEAQYDETALTVLATEASRMDCYDDYQQQEKQHPEVDQLNSVIDLSVSSNVDNSNKDNNIGDDDDDSDIEVDWFSIMPINAKSKITVERKIATSSDVSKRLSLSSTSNKDINDDSLPTSSTIDHCNNENKQKEQLESVVLDHYPMIKPILKYTYISPIVYINDDDNVIATETTNLYDNDSKKGVIRLRRVSLIETDEGNNVSKKKKNGNTI